MGGLRSHRAPPDDLRLRPDEGRLRPSNTWRLTPGQSSSEHKAYAPRWRDERSGQGQAASSPPASIPPRSGRRPTSEKSFGRQRVSRRSRSSLLCCVCSAAAGVMRPKAWTRLVGWNPGKEVGGSSGAIQRRARAAGMDRVRASGPRPDQGDDRVGGARSLPEAEELLVNALDEEALHLHLRSMTAVAAYRPRKPFSTWRPRTSRRSVTRGRPGGARADRRHRCRCAREGSVHEDQGHPSQAGRMGLHQRKGRGLPDLVKLMALPRRHTTAGRIDVPYRHGILHGLDLGYGNRLVAAKAWAALFSLRDWAIKYERGETQPPPVEPPPSLRDTLLVLADVERQRRRSWRGTTRGCGHPPGGVEPRSDTPEAAMPDGSVPGTRGSSPDGGVDSSEPSSSGR